MHAEATDGNTAVSLDDVKCMSRQLLIATLVHWEVRVRGQGSHSVRSQKVAMAGRSANHLQACTQQHTSGSQCSG